MRVKSPWRNTDYSKEIIWENKQDLTVSFDITLQVEFEIKLLSESLKVEFENGYILNDIIVTTIPKVCMCS